MRTRGAPSKSAGDADERGIGARPPRPRVAMRRSGASRISLLASVDCLGMGFFISGHEFRHRALDELGTECSEHKAVRDPAVKRPRPYIVEASITANVRNGLVTLHN